MNQVVLFEQTIAEYFGSPYAVAVDCCTHALELCLRLTKPKIVTCPAHTYLSVPMTLEMLGIDWGFVDKPWTDYYFLGHTNIVDAAVLWQQNSYIDGTFMCLSFQFKKHLNLGRGGMILLDDEDAYKTLKKMRYDGREDDIPWADQNVETMGYHYYMTPETAQLGLDKFRMARATHPKTWTQDNYPDIRKMKVFDAK